MSILFTLCKNSKHPVCTLQQIPLEKIEPLESIMLQDIIEVHTKENYQLYLKFEDGNAGIIDVSEVIDFIGIFEPLKDLSYFKTVKLNPEWGTIYWENGADLDPDILYSVITGKPIPNFQIQKSVK